MSDEHLIINEGQSKKKKTSTYFLLPLWSIALFLVGYLLHQQANFFIWLSCSLLLFILIDPWFLMLRSKKVSSVLAATLLVLASFVLSAIIISIVLYISTDVYQELESSKVILIEYYNIWSQQIKDFMSTLTNYNSQEVSTAAKDALSQSEVQKVQIVDNAPISASMGTTLLSGVGSIMGVLVYILLWPILTFFMLAERDLLAQNFSLLFKSKKSAQGAWIKIVETANAYFLGNFVLLILTVPLFVILFLLFSIENFITLGILAAVINIIPFLGAVLTGIIPALQVLGDNYSPVMAFWMYVICLTIHFFSANFVTPKLLGSRVNLNATTSTIALMIWSLMWGGMGLLLAIPLTAMLKILLESSNHPQLRWLAHLMDNPQSEFKLLDRS